MRSEGRRRGTAVRRLAMTSIAVLALALPASAAMTTTAATRPTPSAGQQADTGVSAGQLTAADSPGALPARGAGAADTAAADAKAAAKPSTGGLAVGNTAIPATALAAYRKAAATLAVEDPTCHLTWPLLAGIGKVETDHGRSWGAASRISSTGEVTPTILGPVLNGQNGTALVRDTDGGKLDHDRTYDRAVGPMQFVPATWRELGRDGNGDGVSDPNNIWDATLAAGGYLCGGSRDLAVPSERRAAILSYNPSSDYVTAVLAWASAYQKAGANLPALEGVPDPLVLGAGGVAGEDPFADDSSFTDDGSGDSSSVDPGTSMDSSATGIAIDPPPNLRPPKKVVKPAAKPTAKPTPKPSAKPSAKPTPKPTGKPAATPSGEPSASPSAQPEATPSPSVSPSPSPSPTPSPTSDPTPTPTPSPTGPTCDDTGITLTSTPSASPVGDNDGKHHALHVTAAVNVPHDGRYQVGVRLLDSSGWRITSTLTTVTLSAGSQSLSADLSGRDIGDAGASGSATVRITVRADGAPASCAQVLASDASAGTLDPTTYDDWTTSLGRLRDRLNADVSSGQVSGDASGTLTADLSNPSDTAPDLNAFRADLTSVTVVSGQEQVRLDSLASRLIAQGSTSAPTEDPSSFNDVVDPSGDGVG